jgi:hypothetical protein
MVRFTGGAAAGGAWEKAVPASAANIKTTLLACFISLLATTRAHVGAERAIIPAL